jgi:hypothetical protein
MPVLAVLHGTHAISFCNNCDIWAKDYTIYENRQKMDINMKA